MKFNSEILLEIPNLIVKNIWIKAGYFPHRLKREEKDTMQCKIRQIYLDKVPKGEWILVVDSDEILGGAIQYIPHLLHIMDHNGIDVGLTRVREIDDATQKYQRYHPQLFKNKEGLRYGGPNEKHDYIEYRDHKYCIVSVPKETHVCEPVNYIDVENPYAWLLEFLYFVHYKRGMINWVLPDEFKDFEIPENLLFAGDMEAMIHD